MRKLQIGLFIVLASTFSISLSAKPTKAKPLPKGCELVGVDNSADNFPDGMHYVAIVTCPDKNEVYFLRDAGPKETPDFAKMHGSFDFPDRGGITLKSEIVEIPKGTKLISEGWRGIRCEESNKMTGKHGEQRVLTAVDMKQMKLKEYWTVDFKTNSLTKKGGNDSKCRQYDN